MMTEQDFQQYKDDVILMIEHLLQLDIKIGVIRDLLKKQLPELPRPTKKIKDNILELTKSNINENIIKDVYHILKDKIKNILLFSNKIVQKYHFDNENDFNAILKYYQNIFYDNLNTLTVEDFATTKLPVNFEYTSINKSFKFFYEKSLVSDRKRVELDKSNIKDSIQSEYESFFAEKIIEYKAFNFICFDLANKNIFIVHDLANIVHSVVLNKEFSVYISKCKKDIGVEFVKNSNFYPKLQEFYDDKDGSANDISFKTPDGIVHHAHANVTYPDARQSLYHQEGEKAVQGKLSIFRILKKFNSVRKTNYTIDLKSVADMTTNPSPTLFQAVIHAENEADFLEALSRLS